VPPGHALSSMNPPGMDQGLAAIATRVAERIAKSTVPRVLQTGEFTRVGKSGRPVLLVWGEADQTVPVTVTKEILKAIPHAELPNRDFWLRELAELHVPVPVPH